VDPTGTVDIEGSIDQHESSGTWAATFPTTTPVPEDATLLIRDSDGLVVKMSIRPAVHPDTVTITIPRPGQCPTLAFTATGTYSGDNHFTGRLYDQNMKVYETVAGMGNAGAWSLQFNPPPGQVYINTTLQVCNNNNVCASMLLNPAL
jgi:hypothetical protein